MTAPPTPSAESLEKAVRIFREESLGDRTWALALALDETRRDTERETALECMRIVCLQCFYARVDDPEEWRPAHHDPKHGWLHRYGNTPNVADCKAEHIRRAFPLVPAPAAQQCDCDSHMDPAKGQHYGDCPAALADAEKEK